MAQSPDALKPVIQANYDAISKAFISKDIKTIDAMLAPDYVSIRGKETSPIMKSRVLAELKGQMSATGSVKWTHTVTKIEMMARDARVTVSASFQSSNKDSKGKAHAVAYTSSTQDLWTKTPTGWKLRRSTLLDMKGTIDGKPMR